MAENRKPLNWKNRFDLVLSEKKCPPGENIPKKYSDDFKFIERKKIDVNSVDMTMFRNVRKELVNNDIVKVLQVSFEQHNYLHDEYPPIVIEKITMRAGEKHYSYGLLVGNHRFSAIKRVGWPQMMVDVYRCPNNKALLSFACTSNHHLSPFKVMSKDDYIKAGSMAAWGSTIMGPCLGKDVKRIDIEDYIEEIVGNMLSKKIKESIVKKIWNDRDLGNEQYQPFCLSKKPDYSINSADAYAIGKNPYAPGIKIPYRGDAHFDDPENVIEELGYIMGNTGGIKDKIVLAIHKYNEYGGKRKVLFYIFIENGKKDLKSTSINVGRKNAVKKFDDEINQYCEFIASLTDIEKDVVKKKINNIFKLVGFLSQKIGTNEHGVQHESTIVDVNGNPVHELTGELLER